MRQANDTSLTVPSTEVEIYPITGCPVSDLEKMVIDLAMQTVGDSRYPSVNLEDTIYKQPYDGPY